MTITAATSSRWMNPPIVTELTRPKAHSTSRITAIVHNISRLLLGLRTTHLPCQPRAPRKRPTGAPHRAPSVTLVRDTATGSLPDQRAPPGHRRLADREPGRPARGGPEHQ